MGRLNMRSAAAALIFISELSFGSRLALAAQSERGEAPSPAVQVAPAAAGALPSELEAYNAHFQATYVFQNHAPFRASYSGTNSLNPNRERSYSFTATGYVGLRLWSGAEFYFNPEAIESIAPSNLSGLGGLSNGENQKGSARAMKTYAARAFLRGTWGLGGAEERVETAANQLSGVVQARRLVLTAGKFSLIDVFDGNVYSHDPRTQFLNWAMMTHGAYDYAADARGYTMGLATEYYHDDWTIRAARALEPFQSNGLQLDYRIGGHHGDQVEVEHAHALGGQQGRLRFLAFRNYARMGSFRDALDFAAANRGAPDVGKVRRDQVKYGYGVSLQQQFGANLGGVLRSSWNDGAQETYAFTEIERSVSAGVNVKGARWGRSDDMLLIGMVRNGLSVEHRDYLAAGGMGYFIGDGQIRYRREQIAEAMYAAKTAKGAWVAFDLQRIRNPAYNADRGPVNIAGLRLHFEL